MSTATKVIIELLLDSGMRIGECLAIQMSDIDLLKNCIVLPWENTKGKKTRTVFFQQRVRKSLRLWIRHKGQLYRVNTCSLHAQSRTQRQWL